MEDYFAAKITAPALRRQPRKCDAAKSTCILQRRSVLETIGDQQADVGGFKVGSLPQHGLHHTGRDFCFLQEVPSADPLYRCIYLTFVRDCFEQPLLQCTQATSWLPGEITTQHFVQNLGQRFVVTLLGAIRVLIQFFDQFDLPPGQPGVPLTAVHTDGMEGIVSISRQHRLHL